MFRLLISDPPDLHIKIPFLRMLVRLYRSSSLRLKDTTCEATLAEKKRDIFKFNAFGLRVEAIHHRNEDCVENREDDERFPLDIRFAES